jgi:hypothetical protein
MRLVEVGFVTLVAAALIFSWRADRRDRSQLESELAATKQLLAAADGRHEGNKADLD